MKMFHQFYYLNQQIHFTEKQHLRVKMWTSLACLSITNLQHCTSLCIFIQP